MTTTEDISLELADAPSIDGLRFRRPRGDDADYEAMASVITAASLHDGLEEIQLARHVRDELEMSVGVDPAVDVVLTEIDGRPVAASGVERTVQDGVVVYDLWGNVHPDVRRRGIGRALLRENLRRAAERAAGETDGQVVEIRSHAQENEAGNRALLDAHGLEPIRWFFLMRRAPLDDVPDTPLPDGLEFRPVTPDQHRAIFDAEVEAFRDHWSSRDKTDEDLERTLKREELDTDLWVVAWDGDEIAGVVQTWVWAEENATLGVDRGWLEHISVRRPWRRKGLGPGDHRGGAPSPGRGRLDRGVPRGRRGEPDRGARAVRGPRIRRAPALDHVSRVPARTDRSAAAGGARDRPWHHLRGRRWRMSIMRSYLIVANQTLTSQSLTDAITTRLSEGPVRTHVVVPLSPVGGRLTWDEAESRSVAQTRLDEVVARLREMGAEADGEVGDRDPVLAVKDALRGRDVDEVIVSTLPKGMSRWLGEDVPSRLRDSVPVPVTVVTQEGSGA